MKTYRETMDELRFTEQEKEAMVDRLLEGGGSRRRGLNLRRAAVAVAAAAVRTVGAGAAVVLTPAGEGFASVLGGAPPPGRCGPGGGPLGGPATPTTG